MNKHDAIKAIEAKRVEEAETTFQANVEKCLYRIASASKELCQAKKELSDMGYTPPEKLEVD